MIAIARSWLDWRGKRSQRVASNEYGWCATARNPFWYRPAPERHPSEVAGDEESADSGGVGPRR